MLLSGTLEYLSTSFSGLALENRVSRFLLTQMETLRKEGGQTVADRLTEVTRIRKSRASGRLLTTLEQHPLSARRMLDMWIVRLKLSRLWIEPRRAPLFSTSSRG